MLERDTLQVLTKAEVKQLLQILNDAQSKQSIKKTEVHLQRKTIKENINIENKELKEEVNNLLYKKGIFLPFFTITLIRDGYIHFESEGSVWAIQYPFQGVFCYCGRQSHLPIIILCWLFLQPTVFFGCSGNPSVLASQIQILYAYEESDVSGCLY